MKQIDGENRLMPLNSVENFRDMGGYRTTSGRELKWRRLFRSGQLSRLTQEEVDFLIELGIREVHDFRRVEECQRFPSRLPDHVTTRNYEMGIASIQALTEMILAGGLTAQRTHNMMVSGYRKFITDLSPVLGEFMKALARPAEHGILMHCLAGKDRTGVASALLLTALDVPRQTVMEDYLLSAEHFPVEAAVGYVRKYMEKMGAVDVSREAIAPYCGVHEEFLMATFDEIDRHQGGMDTYLRTNLGLSDQHFEVLQANFLD